MTDTNPANTTVYSNIFIATGSYTCNFGNVSSVGYRVNSTAVDCVIPSVPFDPYESSIDLYTVNLFLFRDGFNYTVNRVPFSYYECRSILGSATCGSCINVNPFCGWCLDGGTCTAQSFCNATYFTPTACPSKTTSKRVLLT